MSKHSCIAVVKSSSDNVTYHTVKDFVVNTNLTSLKSFPKIIKYYLYYRDESEKLHCVGYNDNGTGYGGIDTSIDKCLYTDI